MEIRVITAFDVDESTGQLQNVQEESHEFFTNLQFSDVINVLFLFVKNGHHIRRYKGFFLKKLFEDKALYYLNDGVQSTYIYLTGDESRFDLLKATNAISKPTRYPYLIIPEYYNAAAQPIQFKLPYCDERTTANNKQIKYTFGIEFETAGGVIPEDLCFGLGLIPLRDGSIGGIEYATVPMSNRSIDLLREQVKCLRKYTTTDSTCSMHIHFGRLPANLKFFYVLYRLFSVIEYELEGYMPAYTFHTEKYKNNGKNYCAHLPSHYSLFEFYNWISGGIMLSPDSTNCTLRAPHQYDQTGNHKWNIPQRYVSLNFINALFYNKNKTVEFRFLKPSYNIHYILNWIYIFNAILKTAEKIYCGNSLAQKTFEECNTFCEHFFQEKSIDINCCLTAAYTHTPTINTLLQFLTNLRTVTKLQKFVGDNIGLKTQFHDIYFKEDPTN